MKEYYILDPKGDNMRFYRLAPAKGFYAEIPPDDRQVIRSETLPGFQFRSRDLRSQPDLTALALDEAYAGYVIPGYREAVTAQRVAEERVQALESELARLRQQDS